VPAAAVIPAPIIYANIAAVKKFVVSVVKRLEYIRCVTFRQIIPLDDKASIH
jgi:hypothetical protein